MANLLKSLFPLLVVGVVCATPTHWQSSAQTVDMVQPCPTSLGEVALVTDNIEELAPAIAEHISGGIGIFALEAQLTNMGFIQEGWGSVWTGDVTGDGFEDVIVNVHEDITVDGYPTTRSLTWLFRCEGSKYVLSGEINHFDLVNWRGQHVGAVGDLTGDSAAEIVTHLPC